MVLHLLTFNRKVSLGLKRFSCREPISGPCFFYPIGYPVSVDWGFYPFTFRVTVERYEFSAIVLSVMSLFLYIVSVPFWSVLLCGSHFAYRIPFNISCRAGLVLTNFLGSVCPGNSVSLLLFWMTALLDKVFLAAYFYHLAHWIYHASPFWPASSVWTVLPTSLMFSPLSVKDLLSRAVFRIFSLSLKFASFTTLCRGVDLFLLMLEGVLCASWIWIPVSFSD